VLELLEREGRTPRYVFDALHVFLHFQALANILGSLALFNVSFSPNSWHCDVFHGRSTTYALYVY